MHIPSQTLCLDINLLQRPLHQVGGRLFLDMPQHQHRRLQQRGGIGNVFPRNIRSRPMHRFKDGGVVSDVRAGNQS